MTVLVPPADDTRRPISGTAASVRARIRGLPAAIRATEYLAVGGGHPSAPCNAVAPGPRAGSSSWSWRRSTLDREHLLIAAEWLRTAVLDLGIEHPENGALGVVSVSIGATLVGNEILGLTDEQWFGVVDEAMYAAKAGGRNQVRLVTAIAA